MSPNNRQVLLTLKHQTTKSFLIGGLWTGLHRQFGKQEPHTNSCKKLCFKRIDKGLFSPEGKYVAIECVFCSRWHAWASSSNISLQTHLKNESVAGWDGSVVRALVVQASWAVVSPQNPCNHSGREEFRTP